MNGHVFFAEWRGRDVTLFDETRCPIRKFRMPEEITGVQVMNAGEDTKFVVTMVNGRSRLYLWNGQLIRS